jgi:hypothetical protein
MAEPHTVFVELLLIFSKRDFHVGDVSGLVRGISKRPEAAHLPIASFEFGAAFQESASFRRRFNGMPDVALQKLIRAQACSQASGRKRPLVADCVSFQRGPFECYSYIPSTTNPNKVTSGEPQLP